MGNLAVTTSSNTTPKLYTSLLSVNRMVIKNCGSRYPYINTEYNLKLEFKCQMKKEINTCIDPYMPIDVHIKGNTYM